MNATNVRGTRCLVLLIFLMLAQTACATGLRDIRRFADLELVFESNYSQVQVGVPIQIRFTVTNKGTQPVIIESKDAPVMDIQVTEPGGGPLLVWSEQNPDKVLHRIEWKPGESKAIQWSWVARREDVYIGARHDIDFTGSLSGSWGGTGVGVRICASDFCIR